jgi:ribosomal protein L40E
MVNKKDLPEHYGYETISFPCMKCQEWNNDKDVKCGKCGYVFE